MSSTASGSKLYGYPNIVNYLTNHDHNHLMVELGDREIFDAEHSSESSWEPSYCRQQSAYH